MLGNRRTAHHRRGVRGKAIGRQVILRQVNRDTTRLGLGECSLHCIQLVVLHQALAHSNALRCKEGVGHASTDQQRIDLVQQVVDDLQLVADFGTAKNRDQRTRRIVEHLRKGRDFLLHQAASCTGQQTRHAAHRSVIAVRGTKGVVDKAIAELGPFGRESSITALVTGVKTHVFQQNHSTRRSGVNRLRHACACRFLETQHRRLQQFRQACAHRLQAQRLDHLALGSPQVRQQDRLGAARQQLTQCRQRRTNPSVIRDGTRLILRTVEVHAYQHAATSHLQLIESCGVQLHDQSLAILVARSTTRQL